MSETRPAAPQRPPMMMGRGGFGAMGGGPIEKPKDFRATLRRLLALLRPQRLRLVLVLLLTSASVALTVVGPRILGDATNVLFDGVLGRLLPAGATKAQAVASLRAHGEGALASIVSQMTPTHGVDFTSLGKLLGLAALLAALGALLMWAQGFIMVGVAQRTVRGLRTSVEEKLGRLPLSYFDSHSRGDMLSRVTNDIDNVATTLQQSMSQLVNSVLTVAGVLVMMYLISPLLATISLVAVPMSLMIAMVIARRSQGQFKGQWRHTGALGGHVEDMHTGHTLVQVFGHRRRAIADFEEHNERLYDSSFRAQFLSGLIQPAMQLVSNLNYVVIAALGGYKVASGTLSLGDVQAFIQYSRQFTMPITQIASQMNLLQSGVASAERVFEVLDADEEVADASDPAVLPAPRGRVTFDDVDFRYVADAPLIEGLTLEAQPGQTVAIVGPTGAGKTTLVNLLMRFYDVDGGAIRIDGTDIRDLRRDTLRRRFGMVLQDTWIFGGTIRDNIAYGHEGATEATVVEAAKAAHFDRFVRTLPDGYDTVLDDEGSNLSSGQRQLLTIARAFLTDPAILILDEATSNVDTRTEVLIQRAMARLQSGRTSFVIAHRLSTIRNADVIVVMDHGRIVEQGSHEELLARGDFYAGLYRAQFSEAYPEAS